MYVFTLLLRFVHICTHTDCTRNIVKYIKKNAGIFLLSTHFCALTKKNKLLLFLCMVLFKPEFVIISEAFSLLWFQRIFFYNLKKSLEAYEEAGKFLYFCIQIQIFHGYECIEFGLFPLIQEEKYIYIYI